MPHNEKGEEVLDTQPLERALRFSRPPSLQDTIKRLVEQEISRQAEGEGNETFEESDDFDVGDDYDPRSPHELDWDQETTETPEQMHKRMRAELAEEIRQEVLAEIRKEAKARKKKPSSSLESRIGGRGGEAPATPPGAGSEGAKTG